MGPTHTPWNCVSPPHLIYKKWQSTRRSCWAWRWLTSDLTDRGTGTMRDKQRRYEVKETWKKKRLRGRHLLKVIKEPESKVLRREKTLNIKPTPIIPPSNHNSTSWHSLQYSNPSLYSVMWDNWRTLLMSLSQKSSLHGELIFECGQRLADRLADRQGPTLRTLLYKVHFSVGQTSLNSSSGDSDIILVLKTNKYSVVLNCHWTYTVNMDTVLTDFSFRVQKS